LIRYSAPAKADLFEIADYLEKEAGSKVAKAIIQRIRRQIRTLERDAHRYRERSELGPGRRALLIGPWIAFYRIESDTVFVQRVLHSARNIKPTLYRRVTAMPNGALSVTQNLHM
jgi:addiction module RelE/StbE family toxin